ncbi:MAG: hypothetical protein UZ07_CHB004002991 [Chlorobi bacterium OLB7]|nr:MAG: hypothetical protein UZ07_CHB004002991 [Chlorobi bacterium OLB7]
MGWAVLNHANFGIAKPANHFIERRCPMPPSVGWVVNHQARRAAAMQQANPRLFMEQLRDAAIAQREANPKLGVLHLQPILPLLDACAPVVGVGGFLAIDHPILPPAKRRDIGQEGDGHAVLPDFARGETDLARKVAPRAVGDAQVDWLGPEGFINVVPQLERHPVAHGPRVGIEDQQRGPFAAGSGHLSGNPLNGVAGRLACGV